MNLSKLENVMKKNKSSGTLLSLPFITCDKEPKIRWFTYDFNQIDDKLNVHIKDIFTANEKMDVRKMESDLCLSLTTNEYKPSKINKNDYFDSLKSIIRNYSEENMQSLLKNTENSPLVIAYNIVHNYDKIYTV